MAERFIIDGNFTQSFNGTINLSADACPADFVIRPLLHYDIDSGNVCYEFDDRVCFEYTFAVGTSNTATWNNDPTEPKGVYSPDISQSLAFISSVLPGQLSFLMSGSLGGDYPVRTAGPGTASIGDVFSILINTQSVSGQSLNDYITQNAGSGSIVLSSATETVEFRYSSQTAPASPNTWKDQVLLGTNQLSSSVSTLNVLVATDDNPFENGDKICVEIRPLGITPSLQEVTEVGAITDITITSSNEVMLYGTDTNATINFDDEVRIYKSGTDTLDIDGPNINDGAGLTIRQGETGTPKPFKLLAGGNPNGTYPKLEFGVSDVSAGGAANWVMGSIMFLPQEAYAGSTDEAFASIAAVTTEAQTHPSNYGGKLRFRATPKNSGTARETVAEVDADEGLIVYNNITASGFISASSGHITGDFKVLGTGSFKVIHTTYETASIIFSSGSTKFGDTFDDTHVFTGSLYITSSNISASISASSHLHASASNANGDYTNVVTYDTATGRFYYTGSYGSGTGGEETLQETMEFGSTTDIAISSSAGTMLSGSGTVVSSIFQASSDSGYGRIRFYSGSDGSNLASNWKAEIRNAATSDTILLARNSTREDYLVWSFNGGDNGGLFARGTGSLGGLLILGPELNDQMVDGNNNGSIIFSRDKNTKSLIVDSNFRAAQISSEQLSSFSSSLEFYTWENPSLNKILTLTSTEGAVFEYDVTVNADISASGDISVNNISASGDITASGFYYDYDNATTEIYVDGDISASGHLHASASDANGNYDNVVVYDTSTGRFYYTGSYTYEDQSLQEVMGIGSSTSIAISSSADMALSGSGDVYVNNVTASNNLKAENQLIVKGTGSYGYISQLGELGTNHDSASYIILDQNNRKVVIADNITPVYNNFGYPQTSLAVGGLVTASKFYAAEGIYYGQHSGNYFQLTVNNVLGFRAANLMPVVIDARVAGDKSFTINPNTGGGSELDGSHFKFYTTGSQGLSDYLTGVYSEDKPFLEAGFTSREFIIGQSSSISPSYQTGNDSKTLIVSGNVDIVGNTTGQSGSLTAQIIELGNTQLQGVEVNIGADGATNVDTFKTANYNGAVYDYILLDTTVGARTGQFMVIQDNGSIEFTDTSTPSLHSDPTEPSISAQINGDDVEVQVTSGNGYTFKAFVKKF